MTFWAKAPGSVEVLEVLRVCSRALAEQVRISLEAARVSVTLELAAGVERDGGERAAVEGGIVRLVVAVFLVLRVERGAGVGGDVADVAQLAGFALGEALHAGVDRIVGDGAAGQGRGIGDELLQHLGEGGALIGPAGGGLFLGAHGVEIGEGGVVEALEAAGDAADGGGAGERLVEAVLQLDGGGLLLVDGEGLVGIDAHGVELAAIDLAEIEGEDAVLERAGELGVGEELVEGARGRRW